MNSHAKQHSCWQIIKGRDVASPLGVFLYAGDDQYTGNGIHNAIDNSESEICVTHENIHFFINLASSANEKNRLQSWIRTLTIC